MKKVLFGLACAATLSAFAQIESSNIVGYESRDLVKDAQVISGANFITVGEDALDIQSIVMDDACVDAGAEIWWWNGSTYDAHAYWYTCLYDAEGTELGYPGWGDGELWAPVEKTFAPGESFWVQANGAAATMTVAGEVLGVAAVEEYFGIDLTKDAQVQLSNPFPTGALDLQTIAMDENCVDAGAEIWWWNGSTYDAHAYWYTCLYDVGGNELNYAGWGDGELWAPINKSFGVGEGFWIQANGADATVKFANPFYTAAE